MTKYDSSTSNRLAGWWTPHNWLVSKGLMSNKLWWTCCVIDHDFLLARWTTSYWTLCHETFFIFIVYAGHCRPYTWCLLMATTHKMEQLWSPHPGTSKICSRIISVLVSAAMFTTNQFEEYLLMTNPKKRVSKMFADSWATQSLDHDMLGCFRSAWVFVPPCSRLIFNQMTPQPTMENGNEPMTHSPIKKGRGETYIHSKAMICWTKTTNII